MSGVSFTNEGSCSDCRMWPQAVSHLYGVIVEVIYSIKAKLQVSRGRKGES